MYINITDKHVCRVLWRADWLVRGNNPDETLMIAVKALDRAEFSVSPLSRIALARKIGSSTQSDRRNRREWNVRSYTYSVVTKTYLFGGVALNGLA